VLIPNSDEPKGERYHRYKIILPLLKIGPHFPSSTPADRIVQYRQVGFKAKPTREVRIDAI